MYKYRGSFGGALHAVVEGLWMDDLSLLLSSSRFQGPSLNETQRRTAFRNRRGAESFPLLCLAPKIFPVANICNGTFHGHHEDCVTMKLKRAKAYRKLMHQYEIQFGFREPYQVRASLQRHM